MVEGVVVETKPDLRQMVVAHRPIDKYMPAMTMAFTVGREVPLDRLTPAQFRHFSEMNNAYRERHGIPFIFAVRADGFSIEAANFALSPAE